MVAKSRSANICGPITSCALKIEASEKLGHVDIALPSSSSDGSDSAWVDFVRIRCVYKVVNPSSFSSVITVQSNSRGGETYQLTALTRERIMMTFG